MLCRYDFNYITNLLENNLFFKKKKCLKFIKKLLLNLKLKKFLHYKNNKLGEYWYLFTRFESLFGHLPKITTLRFLGRAKTKKKKIAVLITASLVFKIWSLNDKKILFILDYILNLNNYLYIKFLFSKRHKINRYENMIRHFRQKDFYIEKNCIKFENNLFFRWLDLSRNFINIWKLPELTIYKGKYKIWTKAKRFKSYRSDIIIFSNYCRYFILPLKIFIKNYSKLILFLFKKFRSRKRNEKAYILL